MMIRSKAVLNSARGAPCALRLPGICNSDPATTVWAHLNGFGKGMGMKTHDILGFPACSSCHAAYDTGKDRSKYAGDALRALCETLVALVLSGLVSVPQDKVTPANERPAKARKPVAQRQQITARKGSWPTAPKRKAEPQHSATRKIIRRSDI